MHAWMLFVVWMLSGYRQWASCQDSGSFSGTNHAKYKTARQDPETLNDFTAARAVDGITSWPACTHTYGPYNLPSNWTVELGKFIYVTGIIIHNRPGFNYRLKNFLIYGISPLAKDVIYNDSNNNAYTENVIQLAISQSRAYSSIEVWIPARDRPLNGDKQNVFTLCEVEVYGVPGCELPNLESHVQLVSRPNVSSIMLTCEPGYTPTENITLTCNDDSVWSGSQPKCNPVRCESPGKVDNGNYVVSNETTCNSGNISDLHYQCRIKTICNEGYRLRNQSERTCQADGRWTNVYPLCDIVTCDFPGKFSNGKYIMGTHNDLSYVYGSLNYTSKIEVKCDTGYKMGNSTIRICESTGKWSGDYPQCSIVQCRFKELNLIVYGHYILNGEIKLDADFANYNDTVSVMCIKGYRQDSNSNATCRADGTWSNQPSSCTIVTCLTPIETSYVKYQTWYNTSYGIFTDKLPYGASVNVTCKQGTLNEGSRIRYCQENGSWDGENPVCGEPTPITEFENVEDRATDNSLTLQWRTGYEGGINQSFQLKYRQKGTTIWSTVNLPHNTNATNAIMDYTIHGLASATLFEVILYSLNTYGNSELTQIIEAMTTEHVCITKDSHAAIVGAAVGGMLGGALVVCCIVAAVVFFQRLRTKKEKESSRQQNSPTHIITNTYMELRQRQEFTSPTSDYSTLDLSGDTRGITTADDGKYVNMYVGKN